MDIRNWSCLPDHILVETFLYLQLPDRCQAALTCKSWNNVFHCPYLWKHFDFWFYMPHQEKYLKCLDSHGKDLQSVYIELDQSVQRNRENACKVIKDIADLPVRKLKSLRVKFTGENPYFYAGKEFVDALVLHFSPPKEDVKLVNSLEVVDLSGLTVAYDDEVFNLLSANHKNLRKLNIQNRQLVCKVTPTCILRLVQRCRKLTELCVFNCSLSEDILKAFTEDERAPLEHLSMICRREEKYSKDFSADVWHSLARKLPNLRVTLKFDHTCPLHKVSEVMKPEIPVAELRLETFTYIYDEVRQATAYYKNVLEKLVLQTPLSRNAPQLNEALLDLATECSKLRSMHVFCVLEKETVDKILDLHPVMKERKSYTLKYTAEPHPWIAGADC